MITLKKFEYAGFGQYTVDTSKNGLILSADLIFLNITGYSEEDIKSGKITCYDLVEADEIEHYLCFADKSTSAQFAEYSIIKKSGEKISVIGCKFSSEENGIVTMLISDCADREKIVSKYDSLKSEFDALNNIIPGGVCLLAIDSNFMTVLKHNDEFVRMFEVTSDDSDISIGKLISVSDFKVFSSHVINCIIEHKPLIDYELKVTLRSGAKKWFGFFGSLYKYENGTPLFHIIAFDVTKSKKLTSRLKMQAERNKIISENTEEIFFDYDVATDVMNLTTTITRYYTDDNNRIKNYLGEVRAKEFVHPEDWYKFISTFDSFLDKPLSGTLEFRTKAYDDDYTWYKMPYVSVADEDNKVAHVFGKMYNIQNLKNMKQRIFQDSEYINYLLTTDSLTGLLNRKSFTEKVSEYMKDADEALYYGISYSDINGFSYVNDNFGFETGNRVLREFADIVTENAATVFGCRIYSDFFVDLYKAGSREQLIESIKQRNLKFAKLQKENFPASELQLATGLYIFPKGSKDVDVTQAIDNANLARRNVKGTQGIICGIYSQRLRDQRAKEQAIASELHTAIKERDLEMFLQPKFSLTTRKIIGAEALCRWRNSDGTYKMPCEFIPVLEKVGYIEDLDFFIYEEVLKTMSYWKRNGKKLIPVSVNFSQCHFNKDDFVERVVKLADSYQIEKKYIEIEVTESCFVGDMSSLFYDMKELRKHEFKIDIDDFGIGYSTLSVLIKAPVDIVKIDKSFIDNLENDPVERDYVDKMCALIGSVKKDIIFEGVESEAQAKILSSSGYTKAQGWLFDKALPIDVFNRKYMDSSGLAPY